MISENSQLGGLFLFRSLNLRRARAGAVGGPSNKVRRAVVIGLVAFFGFGIGASETFAHSRLVRSEPPARAVLDSAPKELKFWFNEPIEPAFAKLWLVPAAGDKIPLANHGDPSDPRLLIGVLPDNLPDGPVVIAYHVLSVDGHVVESQLNFSVNSAKTTTK